MQKIAVVAFVKTPGLSPIKTRLAEGIGPDLAHRFYGLSVAATKAFLLQLHTEFPEFVPMWAVAEADGVCHAMWKDLPRISQGSGTLGERLHRVYSTLREDFDGVCFIGSDSPHLTSAHFIPIVMKIHSTSQKDQGAPTFFVGKTKDGGFYLFCGASPLPQTVWLNTPYSDPRTCEKLITALSDHGTIKSLPESFDIDDRSDLLLLKEELAAQIQDPSFEGQSVLENSKLSLLEFLNTHILLSHPGSA